MKGKNSKQSVKRWIKDYYSTRVADAKFSWGQKLAWALVGLGVICTVSLGITYSVVGLQLPFFIVGCATVGEMMDLHNNNQCGRSGSYLSRGLISLGMTLAMPFSLIPEMKQGLDNKYAKEDLITEFKPDEKAEIRSLLNDDQAEVTPTTQTADKFKSNKQASDEEYSPSKDPEYNHFKKHADPNYHDDDEMC